LRSVQRRFEEARAPEALQGVGGGVAVSGCSDSAVLRAAVACRGPGQGASQEELTALKRVAQFGAYAAYRLRLETAFLADMFASATAAAAGMEAELHDLSRAALQSDSAEALSAWGSMRLVGPQPPPPPGAISVGPDGSRGLRSGRAPVRLFHLHRCMFNGLSAASRRLGERAILLFLASIGGFRRREGRGPQWGGKGAVPATRRSWLTLGACWYAQDGLARHASGGRLDADGDQAAAAGGASERSPLPQVNGTSTPPLPRSPTLQVGGSGSPVAFPKACMPIGRSLSCLACSKRMHAVLLCGATCSGVVQGLEGPPFSPPPPAVENTPLELSRPSPSGNLDGPGFEVQSTAASTNGGDDAISVCEYTLPSASLWVVSVCLASELVGLLGDAVYSEGSLLLEARTEAEHSAALASEDRFGRPLLSASPHVSVWRCIDEEAARQEGAAADVAASWAATEAHAEPAVDFAAEPLPAQVTWLAVWTCLVLDLVRALGGGGLILWFVLLEGLGKCQSCLVPPVWDRDRRVRVVCSFWGLAFPTYACALQGKECTAHAKRVLESLQQDGEQLPAGASGSGDALAGELPAPGESPPSSTSPAGASPVSAHSADDPLSRAAKELQAADAHADGDDASSGSAAGGDGDAQHGAEASARNAAADEACRRSRADAGELVDVQRVFVSIACRNPCRCAYLL
jgi:hypothetical protein